MAVIAAIPPPVSVAELTFGAVSSRMMSSVKVWVPPTQ
jgi:hypothetical protein